LNFRPPRQQRESNKGILIQVVIKNTPAFYADILNGDVVLKIGNIELFDVKTAQDAIAEYAGKEVQIEIWRNGNNINKNVKFNP